MPPKNCTLVSGQDTRIRFSLEPYPGDPSYNQWKDAMKMVARLPEGVPTEFRKKVNMYWILFMCIYIQRLGDFLVFDLKFNTGCNKNMAPLKSGF